MGTAPFQGQPMAMPDPGHVVTRSFAMLCGMGQTNREAYVTIIDIAVRARMILGDTDDPDFDWLRYVAEVAAERLAVLAPLSSDTTRSDNADRGSCSQGRDTRTAQAREDREETGTGITGREPHR